MNDFDLLIECTIAHLAIAEEGRPEGATDMDIVGHVLEQVDAELDVRPTARAWSRTEAYIGTTLGLLQTMRALP